MNLFLFLHPYKIFCLTDAKGAERGKKKGSNFSVILLGEKMKNLFLYGLWSRLIICWSSAELPESAGDV